MFKKSLVLSIFMMIVVAQAANAAYVAVPGDLLRTADDPTVVLVMDNGTRVPLSADAYKVRYNDNFGLVKVVTSEERGSYNSEALTLTATTSLPQSSIFMYQIDQPGIFKVENGFKRLFSTWAGFTAAGGDLNNMMWAGQYTMYPTGPQVQ